MLFTSSLKQTKVALAKTVRRGRLSAAAALTMVLVLLQATVMALPNNPKTNQPARKSKRKARRQREVKPAAPAEVILAREQIAALTQRVTEMSQQLTSQTARPTEDADARREIAELKARIQAAEERASAAEVVASSLRSEMAKGEESTKAAETKIESVSSTLKETQANLKETQTKIDKVSAQATQSESAIRSLGPIRFSGDFRLRADAILRPALANPGPGETALPHVQNVRARYRLRLNLDTDVNPWVSFHGQLSTGPQNNPLTLDQDFGAASTRHPFFISEAWIDFHPTKWFSIQGGRVQEVFADNSRFLFDDDVRFNGFNEKLVYAFDEPVAGFKSIELRAGQYIFTNPNVAIVTPGNLGPTGAKIGSTGRSSQMFHQGVLVNQRISDKISQQFGADIQLYRNPNQIQFASTPAGLPVLVQNGLGLALSGPLPQGGNATTTPGGAIYSAPNFQLARITYRFEHRGFSRGDRDYPISFNLQLARNLGTGGPERDALLTALKVGNVKNRGDQSFLYVFAIKGANAMISQLADDDLGTGGTNIRTHHFRYDIGLAKGVQLQSLFYIQNHLRNSGQYPNFFVPLNAYTPRQYRVQAQIVFTF